MYIDFLQSLLNSAYLRLKTEVNLIHRGQQLRTRQIMAQNDSKQNDPGLQYKNSDSP